MAGLLKWYLGLIEKSPLLTKGVTSATLFGLGDILSQGIDGTLQTKGLDTARVGRMLLWGGPIYTPLAHTWYNKVLEKYVTSTGVKMVATKVVADQLIFAPLINPLIMAYGVMGGGGSWEQAKAKITQEFVPVMKSNWLIWPTVQIINFRIPYINVFVLGWSSYMCFITNKPTDKPAATATAVVPAKPATAAAPAAPKPAAAPAIATSSPAPATAVAPSAQSKVVVAGSAPAAKEAGKH